MTDTERIDWIERFVIEHGALVIHDGHQSTGGHSGLGLCPGVLVRTLRTAIDQCAGQEYPVARAKAEGR